jgi:CBS-domain-containing membrane protein
MRHIRLNRLSDLDRPEIRAYLRQARKRAGLKRRGLRTAAEVVTRVKTAIIQEAARLATKALVILASV